LTLRINYDIINSRHVVLYNLAIANVDTIDIGRLVEFSQGDD